MRKVRRIGILGGTFNPIHIGHLVLAEAARERLYLQKVIFVPCCLPPHKSKTVLTSAKIRFLMVGLAIESNPSFEISGLEIKRGGVSYSIDTARELSSNFPQASLYFIVGSDFLQGSSQWKDIAQLSKLGKFAIAQRPGYPFSKNHLKGSIRKRNMYLLNLNALDISSTNIRARIKAKQSIRYLVPEKVRKYILQKKLYR